MKISLLHHFLTDITTTEVIGVDYMNTVVINFQIIELDGCSLSISNLMLIGNGKLKVKVCDLHILCIE